MKYLKLFEVFDIDWGVDLLKKNIPKSDLLKNNNPKSNFAGFEEDWEDEEPITEKGPFDDILIFKDIFDQENNKFHPKDRVICTSDNVYGVDCLNKKGTILLKASDYLVCFDEYIDVSHGRDYKIPDGHGLWTPENKLRKL